MAEEDKSQEQVGEAQGGKLRMCLRVLGTDKMLYSLGCCRAIVVLLVGILGFMMARKTSGLKYYAKLEESHDSWMPYCRAIVFPEFANGTTMKIDMGTYGGGTALDFETEVNYGIEVSAVKNGASSRFRANLKGKVLEDENCHFIAVEDPVYKTKENQSKVLLMNKMTGKQIKMPLFCGGEKPGPWIEAPDGGMWSWPLLVSTAVWVVMRFFHVIAEAYIVYMGHKKWKSGALWFWLIMVPCFSIFFTLAMNFFIAPLEHMENKSCAQIVTTWYSGRFHAVSGIAVLVLAVCFFCWAAMSWLFPEKAQRVRNKCPCCFCLAKMPRALRALKNGPNKSQGEQGNGDEKKDQQAESEEKQDIELEIGVDHVDSAPDVGNQIAEIGVDHVDSAPDVGNQIADATGVYEGGPASWLIGFTVCVTVPAAVGGLVYSYKYFVFYFFFGIHFDLKISWPEFNLSTQVFWFRSLSSLGVALDIAKNAMKIIHFLVHKMNCVSSDEVSRQTPEQSSDRACA